MSAVWQLQMAAPSFAVGAGECQNRDTTLLHAILNVPYLAAGPDSHGSNLKPDALLSLAT